MTRATDLLERARPVHRRVLDRLAALPWIGPAVVLVIAALTRLIGLAYPPVLAFDETYYVKDAWTIWHLGYEGTWNQADVPKGYTDVNAAFQAGLVNFYSHQAQYVAHPPLGKWIIGFGELLAGGAQNPYGWRLSVAVVGILAVALVMVVAHRMFATTSVTVIAGGLFAIENQAITMSRIGLLDNMVMLFALAAFACVLEDRFWTERRLGEWLMRRRRGIGDWGPAFLWRPWLIAAGVAFGLCCGVKWSGLYFIAAFGLYVVGTEVLLRRRAGVRFWLPAGLLKQGPVTAILLLVPALGTYLATWTGWFVTTGGWNREGGQDGTRLTGVLAWLPAPLKNLWDWHHDIYIFHTTLDSPHAYAAPAIGWPIIARPTSIFYDGDIKGCPWAGQCVSAITDLPNPLIWYAGWAAAVYLVVRFVRHREWQAALILMGFVAGYLPWLLYPKRTMFFFYTIAFEPYLLLALAATIGLMLVRPPALDGPDELAAAEAAYGLRVRRRIVVGFLAVAVLLSIFYLPLSTGIPTPQWFWQIHMWSRSWI
ncbi:dolichyl-phosphate-mannose--protein mannosyltransferase [Amnibacterium endophyticum]|uniref:Polyprenol-phosphate-mannose--protein mannosyltransferase n=1 Tax=Amnibacterium endophyticum TaxID=2109337 RepID=A0ABW4LJ08_9MICO